jgi:hypothetical protein
MTVFFFFVRGEGELYRHVDTHRSKSFCSRIIYELSERRHVWGDVESGAQGQIMGST